MTTASTRNTGDLLAVDPALNSTGVALFRAGILVAADRIRTSYDPKDHEPIGARVLRVARGVVRWVAAHNSEPRAVVYEWPQIYGVGHSDGDPNDLPPLAAIGSAVCGILAVCLAERNIGLEILTPTPREWAGQLPKTKRGDPWDSPRGARIQSRLSPEEFALVPKSHDALDGVGLGLWAIGRFERRRVFPGATVTPPPELQTDPPPAETEDDPLHV